MSSSLLTLMHSQRSGGSAWTPAALSDVRLVLDASRLTGSAGDAISHWSDGSTLGRDAAGTSGSEPTVSTIGSGPAAAFNGSQFLALGSSTILSELRGHTHGAAFLFTVGRRDAYQTLFSKNVGGGHQLFFIAGQADNNFWRWDNIKCGFDVCDGAPHLAFYDVDIAAETERLVVDGVTATAAFADLGDAGDDDVIAQVGATPGGGFPFVGKQSLIIMRSAVWTDTEMAQVHAYCVARGWLAS